MCRQRRSPAPLNLVLGRSPPIDVMHESERIYQLLSTAKAVAQEYRELTGKPLGITGEVAEFEAARILGVQLTPARQAGYDAVEQRGTGIRRHQIKGRCIHAGASRSQMVGSIDTSKPFDSVLLVLLDAEFNAFEIYEADREAVIAALAVPGSKLVTNAML
jgi:hypothetical protein